MDESYRNLARSDSDLQAILAVVPDPADEGHAAAGNGDTVITGGPDGGIVGEVAGAVLPWLVHLHNVVHAARVLEPYTSNACSYILMLCKYDVYQMKQSKPSLLKKKTYREHRRS
jgi:hypothetical protein